VLERGTGDMLIEQRVNFNKLIDAFTTVTTELEELKKVVTKVNENETKVNNLIEKTIPDLEARVKHDFNLMHAKLIERIDQLEKDKLMENAHSRRLHIICNGIPLQVMARGESEPTEQLFRQLLVQNLKMDPGYVNGMLFRDVHRLPKSNKHAGPPPIIAAFLCQQHRNDVLSNAKELKNTNISLKSDLPKELNILRGKFLKERHRLVEAGHTVRVVERGYLPVLQKKGDDDRWSNILTFDKTLPLQAALHPVLPLHLRELVPDPAE
jgi:hypothetical protein